MIVHHAYRLHEGIANGGSYKIESALLEILAHGIGLRGARLNLLRRPDRIHSRLASDELPDITVEAAKLFLHLEERSRIRDGGSDFEFVAHDSSIGKQLLDLLAIIGGDALDVEAVECPAVIFALVEDRAPTQSGLRTFQDEKFEELAIVVNGNAPLFVMIANHLLAIRPGTARGFNLLFCGLGHDFFAFRMLLKQQTLCAYLHRGQ